MYLEEAAWIRERLAGLDLPDSPRVLNAASSTEHYRTVEQPHNHSEVIAPLLARGASVTHLDMKKDPGVDVVVDLNDPALDLAAEVGEFDLVMATGLLEHFDSVQAGAVIGKLFACCAPAGWMLFTTPLSYRMTPDPVDFGFRPTPHEVVEMTRRHGPVEVVAAQELRISSARYYKGFVSRTSTVKIGKRWVPLPGAHEQLRRIVPRWRWVESCVIVQRTSG